MLVVHEYGGGWMPMPALKCSQTRLHRVCRRHMYGEGKQIQPPKDAVENSGKVRMNVEDWKKRGTATLERADVTTLLRQRQNWRPSAIASVDRLAATGLFRADLKAVASFHGGLVQPTADQVKNRQSGNLICNGADDSFIQR